MKTEFQANCLGIALQDCRGSGFGPFQKIPFEECERRRKDAKQGIASRRDRVIPAPQFTHAYSLVFA